MYNKKEMKLISFEKMKKLMMQGETVYMVMMDGQLVEITADTDWQMLFFHNIRGGSYAVYRKKFTGVGTFKKAIHSDIPQDPVFFQIFYSNLKKRNI